MTQLSPQQIQRRRELTSKLQIKTITTPEANELKELLEKEKVSATSLGDVIAILAIAFLIGAVISFLTNKD